MENHFNIKPGDLVKLTVAIDVEEPAINDGDLVTLKAGWTRKLIRFTDDGKNAELEYHDGLPISVKVPAEYIVPA